MNGRLATAALAGVGLLVSGCGFTAGDLARANNSRGDGYLVSLAVPDALNLPDGSPVRIGGVSVGKVDTVKAKDYEAIVTLKIHNDTHLTDQAKVRLRYTTALGEMYVQIEPSATGTPLKGGEMLARTQSETAPSVEDALASASLLINGGGLGSIETIVTELNKAVDGRVPTTHALISKLDTFMRTVTGSQRQIDRILTALAATSKTLNARQDTINKALVEIRPAAKTLTDNTPQLVALLKEANKLGATAKRIVDANRGNVEQVVRELGPVLQTINANSDAILSALANLRSAAPLVRNVARPSYANLYAVAHFGADALLGGLTSGNLGGTSGGTTGGTGGLLGGTGGLLGGGTTSGGSSGGGLLGLGIGGL
ncbi:MCE family protein [Nocardioides jiangxiensis]|uniref:MCE family protein n=1 Tax=Nocardioides jiangxiensis TaxID=3064524 RepID=A0ABT9B3U2_9ACTN|nr:MCE family protein [Nocardioides sp. WY-20]MDO7869510.1 MCE family protein [Nocardioides sp. WY-20]